MQFSPISNSPLCTFFIKNSIKVVDVVDDVDVVVDVVDDAVEEFETRCQRCCR